MFIKGISEEEGEVIAVNGDSVTVKIKSNKACDKCNLCERVSPTEMVVDALASSPLKNGEKVKIFVRPGTIIKSATVLYILPLLGLVIGYYTGKTLGPMINVGLKGEFFPAILSLVFLFASFIPIRIYDRKKQRDNRFRIYAKEIV
jgi:sigma-E factor negative regulatory protein RseC